MGAGARLASVVFGLSDGARFSKCGISDVECRAWKDGLVGRVPAGGICPVAGPIDLGSD